MGFEPTEALNLTRFRIVRLRPLGHLSAAEDIERLFYSQDNPLIFGRLYVDSRSVGPYNRAGNRQVASEGDSPWEK